MKNEAFGVIFMLVFVFISFIRIFGQYVFVFIRYSVGIVFCIAQSNAFTWSFLSFHSSTDHVPYSAEVLSWYLIIDIIR